MMRISVGTCVLLAALLAHARPLHGQAIGGTLTGTASGRPVTAAFVALEDSTGARVAATLSDDAGAFALRARGPGRYRLRVERLALRTEVTDWFELAPDRTVRRDMRLDEEPFALPQLFARASSRGCRATGELGADAALLWDEARKALTVAAWTAETQPLRLLIQRSLRERYVGRRDPFVDVEDSTVAETRGSPWRSAPAEDLARHGFVRRHGAGYLYFGPDANLLLSPVFLDSHCFELAQERLREGLVGLRFRPRQTPHVTDIQGTLWLRRDSLALHSLDYAYVRLPYRFGEPVGGRAAFRRLPNGSWIVAEWGIDAPRPSSLAQGAGRQTLLVSQHGARVVDALDYAGRSVLGVTAPVAALERARDLPIPGGAMPPLFWAVQRCEAAPHPDRAHVIGTVSDDRGRTLPYAAVRLTMGHGQTIVQFTGAADEYGIYVICNALTDREMAVEGAYDGYLSVAEPLGRRTGRLIRADIVLRPDR